MAHAVMGTLPADVRRKKVLSYCRLFFQTPDMESQVARCMASQFPIVLAQVRAAAIYSPANAPIHSTFLPLLHAFIHSFVLACMHLFIRGQALQKAMFSRKKQLVTTLATS